MIEFFDSISKQTIRNIILLFLLLLTLIPFIVLWEYVEWVKKFIQIFKNRKELKQTKSKSKKKLILYKYRTYTNFNNEEYKKNYIDGKLYFSNREDLNDPAEILPLIDHTVSITPKERSVFKREDENHDPLNDYKICSMTSNPGNFVMWANYAENHTGVCIGIEIYPGILKKKGINLDKVVYTKSLPVINDFVYPYDFDYEDYTWSDIRKLLFYKLTHWKYEDEWRLVKKTKDSPEMCYVGKVVRILCGLRCTPEYVNQLKELLKDKEDIIVDQVEMIVHEHYSGKSIYLSVPEYDPGAFGNFSNNEWKYRIEDEGVIILAYIGKKNDIEIPAIIRKRPVIAIGENAFHERLDITSITIPPGIVKIEPFAFLNCSNISAISLGKDVKIIGRKAFSNCYSLTSINLPESIAKIGKGAFQGCYNLATVTLPKKVSIGRDAFMDCPCMLDM